MAWIELHGELWGHGKVARLARKLKIQKAHALGHLASLWAYTIDRHPSGILDRDEVEDAAQWERPVGSLLSALLDLGWLDATNCGTNEQVSVHDWADYTKGYKRALADAERMRTRRAQLANGSGTVHEQSTDGLKTVGVTRPDPDPDPEQTLTRPTTNAGWTDEVLRQLFQLSIAQGITGTEATLKKYVIRWRALVGAATLEEKLRSGVLDHRTILEADAILLPSKNGSKSKGNWVDELNDLIRGKPEEKKL